MSNLRQLGLDGVSQALGIGPGFSVVRALGGASFHHERLDKLGVAVSEAAAQRVEFRLIQFGPDGRHTGIPLRPERNGFTRPLEDAEAERAFPPHVFGFALGSPRSLNSVLHWRADVADRDADRSGGFWSHQHQRPVWPEVFAFAGTVLAADKARRAGVELKQIFQHFTNTARRLGW